MKTIVLDDDPTGTQSASGVDVLLEWDTEILTAALTAADSVYILTNTRALEEHTATERLQGIRAAALEAAQRLGDEVSFVLRGDSTLRGHVFAETEVFAEPESIVVFVPAYPAGGRITIKGTHLVKTASGFVPAHETEYADDPVFPFTTSVLADYVAQRSTRPTTSFALSEVRGSSGELAQRFANTRDGSVVTFDVETDDDVRVIARLISAARLSGRDIVVRSAAPLAAELAGVASGGLLPLPIIEQTVPTLLVCGSHTHGATAQLQRIIDVWGEPDLVSTAEALADPIGTGRAVGARSSHRMAKSGLGFLSTERERSLEHNTLAHGELVMEALTAAVRTAVPTASAVVSKGGITSAEVARVGIGAKTARVRGQVLPGVSVWDLKDFAGRDIVYVVVPGNVGDPDTIADVLDALSCAPDAMPAEGTNA